VPEGDITYYDEDGTVDVAMITLSSNVDGQHHLDMSKIRHGVQGEPVDICGIDKENEARAPRNDHTLSTYDPAIEAWRLDHQVRGGYSGGLVATGNTPLGIVFRRHKVDQVTLIFPLTSLREWIEKDTPSTHPSNTPNPPEVRFSDFCVLIDRPKQTREVIMEAVKERTIGGFVCVAESIDKHNPPEFGKNLMMRVDALGADNEHERLLQVLNEDRFEATRLARIDLREIKTGGEFSMRINHALYEDLVRGPEVVNQEMTESEKRQAIVELMKFGKTPRVFWVNKYLKTSGWVKRRLGNSQSKEIEILLSWITQWNREWQAHDSVSTMPPLVLLLIVDADEPLAEKFQMRIKEQAKEQTMNPIPLPLTKIDREDFDEWLDHGRQLLQATFQVERNSLDRIRNTTEKKLLNEIQAKREVFPIYYQQFEKISQVLNPQKELKP
jgi:hypothetical protein